MRILLFLLVPLSLLAAPPDIALEDVLPPLEPWSGRSESLVLEAGDPWVTPGEDSGLTRSPSYDETVAWLRKLVAAAPELEMVSLGRSPEGRDIWMVIASRERRFTPEALRASGKPTLFVQAGIHSGEIDGKDAGMMLLRDMTVRGTQKQVLERANLLFVPIFSVDGHERASRFSRINQRGPEVSGWRTTSQNLNLNRDYTKADTPEMRAMIAALRRWEPDLYLDIHVTDGADYQYDITYGYNGEDVWSPAIARWLAGVYEPAVDAALTEWGHIPGPLIFGVDDSLRQGIVGWVAPPRYSHGYGDARHIPSVLYENHSFKPFRQRVLGTYVALVASMEVLGREAESIRKATAEDRARRAEVVPLEWTTADTPSGTVEFRGIEARERRSPITGGLITEWTGRPYTREVPFWPAEVASSARRPKAYWIPPAWTDVIEQLDVHGIRYERTSEPVTREFEMYRLDNASIGNQPFEGHVLADAEPRPVRRSWTFPANSVRVPTDQPLGILAMLLLEPASTDSVFTWGLVLEPLSRTEYVEGYVMEPMAARMLELDPELRAEFEQKVREDEAFRQSARRRLEWFYERTPYVDARWRLYPIAREVE